MTWHNSRLGSCISVRLVDSFRISWYTTLDLQIHQMALLHMGIMYAMMRIIFVYNMTLLKIIIYNCGHL